MNEKMPYMHFSMCRSRRTGDLTPTKFIRVRVCENCNPNFPRICKAKVLPLNEAWSRRPVPPKKHLDTCEFKQQQEELARLAQEAAALMRDFLRSLGILGQREEELKKSIEAYGPQPRRRKKSFRISLPCRKPYFFIIRLCWKKPLLLLKS